jgi:integrase
VILAPGVVDLLARRRDQATHSDPEDYIFGTATGTALDHRHIGTAFRLAVKRADLHGRGRLSPHSLRHGTPLR